MKNKLIEFSGVNVVYTNPQGEKFNALKDITLDICEGEYVAILGTSGSGKTTLSNIIGMLNTQYTGEYVFDGEPMHRHKEKQLVKIRGEKFGFIFQDYVLLDYLTALENVAQALQYTNLPKKVILQKAREKLISVGLGEKLNHRPYQLSGGQKQRVSIARALIKDPKVIIADEPTGALDHNSRVEILSLLQDLNHQGVTIITVTHSMEDAQAAKRIIQVEKGEIRSDQIQRNRHRFFGKLVNLENQEEFQLRKTLILEHVNLKFGIQSEPEFIRSSSQAEQDGKIKLLNQLRPQWLRNQKIAGILSSWFSEEDQLIQLIISAEVLKAGKQGIEVTTIGDHLQDFYQQVWNEETSMFFLMNLNNWKDSGVTEYLIPLNFFKHPSQKVRATAINLLKNKGFVEDTFLGKIIDTSLTDPDHRVRSNMLDYLYAKQGVHFSDLEKFKLHLDPSSRVKAIWAEMLIVLNRKEEAMHLLEHMMFSKDQSHMQAAIWVLAKSSEFKIHEFLAQKLDSTPHLMTAIDEILKTYERVKTDMADWRIQPVKDLDKEAA